MKLNSCNVGGRHKSDNHTNKCKIVIGTTAMKQMTFILREHVKELLAWPERSDKALKISRIRSFTIEEGLEEYSKQWKQHV